MTEARLTSQHPAFIAYPWQAAFGRTLPKNKVYEHSGAKARLKDLFIKQVEQIVWAFKLAPETLRLPARPGVPEIQVFSLRLKTPELDQDVLRCIDGAIPFPILFELTFDGRTQVIAAYKRPNESDASRWVLSNYFASDWRPVECQRTVMPVALHMGGLYEQLLHRLIPFSVRSQESLVDLVARVELAQAKQRELEKTMALLAKERQFNRKLEINAHLRQLKNEYAALSR